MARKKYGIDRLISDLFDRQSAHMDLTFERLSKHYDSPIEVLFLMALTRCHHGNGFRETACEAIEGFKFEEIAPEDLGGFQVHVFSQVRFTDWPADFVVVARNQADELRYAVIECDGHDFHERTKEQAKRDRSRDRAVQERGARMFRFTGSEIYSDPFACALEVMRWADEVVLGGDEP